MRPRISVLRIAQVAVVALTIIAPVWGYLSHSLPLANIANADMVAVPALVEAVKTNGLGELGRWYWPPAPYFLIDYLLYVPIWLAFPNPWLAPALFMAAQLGILYLSMRRLAVRLFSQSEGRGAAWGATFSFSLLVFLSTEPAAVLARFILVSYYRAGNVILTLLSLALLAKWITAGRPDQRPRVAAGLGLLALLAAASDPLLVASLMVPLAGVVTVLSMVPEANNGWARHRKTGAIIVGAAGVGSVLGLVINGRLATSESEYGPALTGGQMRHQARLALDVIVSVDRTLLVLALAGVTLSVVLVIQRWRQVGTLRFSPLLGVLVFLALSSAGHILAILIDTNPPAVRYLIVPILIPITLIGPVLAVTLTPANPLGPLRSLAAGSVALAVAGVIVNLHTPPAPDWAFQPTGAACLDQILPNADYDRGLGGYWQARFVPLHSEVDRELAPTTSLGEPDRINASSDWFGLPYDFAIVESAQTEWDPPINLLMALAPDATVTECGEYTIIDAGEAGLDMAKMDHPGGRVSYDGCALGTILGSVGDDCVIHVPLSPEPGFGSYGGYTPLRPGDYLTHLTYSTSAAPGTELGTIEIVRLRRVGPDIEVVSTSSLLADGDHATARIPVHVPDDGSPFILEVRTLSAGTSEYRVESVTIENP